MCILMGTVQETNYPCRICMATVKSIFIEFLENYLTLFEKCWKYLIFGISQDQLALSVYFKQIEPFYE